MKISYNGCMEANKNTWPAACAWRPQFPTTCPEALGQSGQLLFDQLCNVYESKYLPVLERLRPALICSPWAMDLMRRREDLFVSMLDLPQLGEQMDEGSVSEYLSSGLSEPEYMAKIRAVRQREMVRIALRDLMGWASLEQTLAELSALAEYCISQSISYAKRALLPRFGLPRNGEGEEQELLVLGMGKLGGAELNFSSDIDLIFLYPESGATDGKKSVDNQAYFIRLGQLVIKLLDELTVDGFVFRVDMRLRPFGDAGALAVSFAAAENYYQTQGREWERYAMIKAKALTGRKDNIAYFKSMLKPFVFRRYLDFSAIQSLRELKRMIEEQVKRKGMAQNIKLGRGGIREVEFIGQAFQLIYGGKNQGLQQRGIVAVLQQLEIDGLLERSVVDSLLKAYAFLRLAENRLQMVGDEQTHDLPEDDLGKARLAYSMGFDAWEIFLSQLNKHRDLVAQQFSDVFSEAKSEEKEQEWQSLWCAVGNAYSDETEEESVEQNWKQQLSHASFEQVDDLFQRLKSLRTSSTYTKASAEARKRVDSFIPVLMASLQMVESNRDEALKRALEFMRAVVRRSIYLVLLEENPKTLQRLLHFFSQSEWMAEQLIQQPVLLDQLIDTRLLYALNERPELDKQLSEQLDAIDSEDFEGLLNALRGFKRSYTLSVAAVDVTGHMPLMRVSDHLTQCAEVLVQETHRLAWVELTKRHGFPHCRRDGIVYNPGMAVIGYGKLGGIELGYSSDLDVVFLHDSGGEREYTSGRDNGKGDIDNTLFFARLAQKFSSIMNAQTRTGQLYEVDTRLRPDGDSGEWVKSIEGFAQYQKEKAWTWEHQALVRSRFICGSPELKMQFESIRKEILCIERNRDDLRQEVVDMREKMRANLGGKDGAFSLKQDRGGLTDIEFMVQFAVLGWSHKYPELTKWTDNIRILEVMSDVGVISEQDSSTLIESYRAIRAKIHRLALDRRKSIVDKPGELAAVVADAAGIWQRFMLSE